MVCTVYPSLMSVCLSLIILTNYWFMQGCVLTASKEIELCRHKNWSWKMKRKQCHCKVHFHLPALHLRQGLNKLYILPEQQSCVGKQIHTRASLKKEKTISVIILGFTATPTVGHSKKIFEISLRSSTDTCMWNFVLE